MPTFIYKVWADILFDTKIHFKYLSLIDQVSLNRESLALHLLRNVLSPGCQSTRTLHRSNTVMLHGGRGDPLALRIIDHRIFDTLNFTHTLLR